MNYPHFEDNAPETQEDHESAQGREGRGSDCVLSHMMASPEPRVDTATFSDGLYASRDAVYT